MVKVNEIKAQMKRVGITQEKLAEKMGINQATLNRKVNNREGDNLTVKEVTNMVLILQFKRENITDVFFGE